MNFYVLTWNRNTQFAVWKLWFYHWIDKIKKNKIFFSLLGLCIYLFFFFEWWWSVIRTRKKESYRVSVKMFVSNEPMIMEAEFLVLTSLDRYSVCALIHGQMTIPLENVMRLEIRHSFVTDQPTFFYIYSRPP